MLGFTFDGQAYEIQFRHGQSCPPNVPMEVRSTACTIFIGHALHWYEGRSWCHGNDQFSKETGRKLALERALTGRTRDFRTAAWKAYFARKGG